MSEASKLPDPELAFGLIEGQFIYKTGIKDKESPAALKLKRYSAFLYFYFLQAEEKYRMFDTLRPKLDIVSVIKENDPRMTIWWWSYLDTIVHTSNLFDKPTHGNEPASLPYIDSKLPGWAPGMGIKKVPKLVSLEHDEGLKNLLDLRDKLVIHIEPKSYFKVMFNLRDVPDFFEHLINEVAKPYLEAVYDTFFENPPMFNARNEIIESILKLNLKIE